MTHENGTSGKGPSIANSRFWMRAQEQPHRIALVDPTGARISAGELFGAGNQAVRAARARGVRAGDTVAALLPNCPRNCRAPRGVTAVVKLNAGRPGPTVGNSVHSEPKLVSKSLK